MKWWACAPSRHPFNTVTKDTPAQVKRNVHLIKYTLKLGEGVGGKV